MLAVIQTKEGLMRSHFVSLAAAASLVVLVGCNNDPAKGKSTAAVSDPATAVAPSGAGVKYSFDQTSSKVEFVGAKVTRKHDGSFGTFNGTVNLVDNNPEKSQVTVEIDTASLSADEAKLTGHLKSPDLLDVGKYPKARFTSTSIKPGGEKGATHTVTGNFELHGVTKSITFPATIKTANNGVDVDAEFAINRKDFGIVYPGMPDDLIKDEVLIKLQVRSKKVS
jgi:polyisoprenoid-binding protein YceI